jgi:hypothetical protein
MSSGSMQGACRDTIYVLGFGGFLGRGSAAYRPPGGGRRYDTPQRPATIVIRRMCCLQ